MIKFAHHAPVTYPYQDGALKFKEVAEKLSGGKLDVQVFGGAQLGGERDLLEGIKLGTLQIASAPARWPTSRPPTTSCSCRS